MKKKHLLQEKNMAISGFYRLRRTVLLLVVLLIHAGAGAQSIPNVKRVPAAGIGADTATVGGLIASNGGNQVTESGVVYSITPHPARFLAGVTDSSTNPVVSAGGFSFRLTGLSAGTIYYYRAYAVNTSGISYGPEDSFTTHPVIQVLPYAQNFDGNQQSGWASAAIAGYNDWQLGTPSKPRIAGPFSAPNCWVTRLSGPFSPNSNSYLLSPRFDFSNYAADPVISFYHNFSVSSNDMGAVAELSLDGGISWNKLDPALGQAAPGGFNTAISVNWYNSNSSNAPSNPVLPPKWANNSGGVPAYTPVNGWIRSQTRLAGAGGKANVRVRFRMGTTGSSVSDGWAIDDIEVFEATAPEVATRSKHHVTSTSAILDGYINTNGNNTITASGIVIGTNASPVIGNLATSAYYTTPLADRGQFSVSAGSLQLNTVYYYRAFAINGVDTAYGTDSTFITAASTVPPVVTAQQAFYVTARTATLQGHIEIDGGSAVTISGIVFGTSPNPVLSDPGVTDSTTSPVVTTGDFYFNLAGLSPQTKYYYRAYATNIAGTGYSVTDSFTTTVLIASFPYSENFDNTGTLWTSDPTSAGGTNAWERGAPSKPVISSAFSAPNCFVTGLTGNYPAQTDCLLQSPEFDFSTVPADAVLTFTHKMQATNMEGFDGGIVEISVNGNSWSQLDPIAGTGSNFNTATSTGWYNNTANSVPLFSNMFSGSTGAYASQVNGWVTSAVRLTGSAGQQNVRVRFRFAANVFFQVDEGWAIDDIRVTLPAPPEIVTGTRAYTTPAQATLSGTIVTDNNAPVTASGVVIGQSAAPVKGGTGVIDSAAAPAATSGTFSVDVDGLTPGALYYYRAYAINATGTAYGADSTFTTPTVLLEPAVILLKTSQIGAAAATVNGKVINNGGAAVTLSGIVYATTPMPVLSGSGVTDSVTAAPVNYGTFAFNLQGLTPSTTYYFRAYAQNSVGVRYSSQDSFTTAPLISSLPYMENFDTGPNHGWTTTSTGGTNSWQLGTPAKATLNSAFNGNNAWVTGLTGSYTNGENAAIISPRINCSGRTTDPVLRFMHRFSTGFVDGGVVEISLNGGSSWAVLDNVQGTGPNFNTATSNAWYNEADPGFFNPAHSTPIFSGQSSAYASQATGWIQSSVILTGAAGNTDVRVRFRFATTTFTFFGVDEGWEIDQIEIIEPAPAGVITGTHRNVFVSSASLEGNITSHGNSVLSASGIVYATTPSPVRGGTGVADSASAAPSTGTFTVQAGGLLPSTQYYYRTYAVNTTGIAYGADSTFTTPATAGIPAVSTGAARASSDYAAAKGTILRDSGSAITSSGIIYGTSASGLTLGSAGTVSVPTNPLVTAGDFEVTLTTLAYSARYYYRSYAENATGISYGNIDSFETATPVSSFPYAQNFDLGSAGWSAHEPTGGPHDWVLGTPAKAQLSSAHSQPNAWVTKLTGNYTPYVTSYLQSPLMDFTTATQDPILRFYHNFLLDNQYDYCGAVVQISPDEGITWNTLDQHWPGYVAGSNTDSSYAWYNNAVSATSIGAPKWSGSSTTYPSHTNGWIQSATRLTGAAGKNKVLIRFLFSAQFQPNEGWAIDDIEIVLSPVAPGTAASTVSITPGTTTAQVSWTKGNGNARIVVARLANDPPIVPVNGILYQANPVFGQGAVTAVENFVVYNDTGTSVTVTGLSLNTSYAFDVYEYNGKYMHTAFGTTATANTTTTPVKLAGFAASTENGDGLLTWATASEKNNAGFDIERSVDGKRFERIGFVQGAGSSNRLLRYAYRDANVFKVTGAATVYYRLMQKDRNGRWDYSTVVTISNAQTTGFRATAYPVPFAKELNMKVTSDREQSGMLQLLDIRGGVITTQSLSVTAGEQVIRINNLETLDNGIYFVKMTLDNRSQVIRVVKID